MGSVCARNAGLSYTERLGYARAHDSYAIAPRLTAGFVLAAVAVTFGAWVQASVGFGYALLAAPLVALVAPSFVPAAIMVSSALLSLWTALRERQSVDARGIGWALLGRLPGVALSVVIVTQLSAASMNLVFGGLVLAAVALSLSGLRLPLSPVTLMATGFVSGVMGTLTSIGGPPMALIYQPAEGPRLRASLNAYFAAGSCMSLAALYWAGRFGQRELLAGALLLPACALGFVLSTQTRRLFAAGRTRGAVLSVASVSAVAVVLKTLWQTLF